MAFVPAAVRQRVMEIYPAMVGLLDDPEIGPLLAKAVGPMPFSPSRFQAELQKTHWFRRQSENQRRWSLLLMTDPGTAREMRSAFSRSLADRAYRFGGQLNSNQVKWITELAMQHGISDVNDPRILKAFRILMPKAHGGDVGVAYKQVSDLAEGQWFYRPAAKDIQRTAVEIATGIRTIDDLNRHFAEAAVHRYPHLAGRIKAGETLADITANQRQIVAEELEMSGPGQVDVMRNSDWRKLLGIRDPKTHKVRMMTDSEVLTLARDRPQWWKTANGRKLDTEMTAKLLDTFGQRAL